MPAGIHPGASTLTTSAFPLSDPLQPRLSVLRREDVLVQAWKKASAYIRYHNWFSDTLELDWTSVNLPDFIASIAVTLTSANPWHNDRIRIVPAPKVQPGWQATAASDWMPPSDVPLRPLAHVTLRDQVVATAILLCLADRIETRQGDPRVDINRTEHRKTVVSYGNRLFCDTDQNDDSQRHRWGSTKLYRKYFQDYRTFLARPETVARELIREAAEHAPSSSRRRPFIVCMDLSKFYDRVRPALLTRALDALSSGPEERSFFAFASSMLRWRWHPSDIPEVKQYETEGQLTGFSDEVSLPQGLVASGFFANVVLLELDELAIVQFDREIMPGIYLHDFCRYVDDIRLVVSTAEPTDAAGHIGCVVRKWLQGLIDEAAPELQLNMGKTKTVGFGEGSPQLIRIGATMDRIQTAVSGGFDAVEGERILDTVQSLIKSQPAAFADDKEDKWNLSQVPDVTDDTLARFCAARFRTTYRSVRPLVDATDASATDGGSSIDSQEELDDQARSFALTLIHRWVKDPANIRILRIGLDIWPHANALRAVLDLLHRFVWSAKNPTNEVRVAWYCLSEIFRAGATETGMVESLESLHGGIKLDDYHNLLRTVAKRVMAFEPMLPWYLRQQAFLFLAASGHVGDLHDVVNDLPSHYGDLVSFLSGDRSGQDHSAFATAAIIVRRALRARNEAVGLVLERLDDRPPREISGMLSASGARDLSFVDEILEDRDCLVENVEDWLRFELGRVPDALPITADTRRPGKSLTEWVQQDASVGPLRNELTLLRFGKLFLEQWRCTARHIEVITPNQVHVDLKGVSNKGASQVGCVAITGSTGTERSIYSIPEWCHERKRWRLQLGYLLRFVLGGRPDYTRPIREPVWREERTMYRPPESHWYLRRYGFFSAQSAFGDDWLPVSDWLEDLLLALLRWPGCRPGKLYPKVRAGIDSTLLMIESRILQLEKWQGRSTGLLVLPMFFRRREPQSSIHACVAQSVIPGMEDFGPVNGDPTLSHPDIRGRHRSHLATTLMAVRTAVKARASHLGGKPRLDWLILPELAVHPSDIRTHVIPFARAHKALVLTGLTYQKLQPSGLPTNSALWLMPECSPDYGLQVRTRRQGKQHLAPDEQKLNVEGFRPCQWLIEYPCKHSSGSVRLTASVCYDATDLRLISDLRDKSDVFAIPALNKDVKTFDRMALALHYHMFQLVIVANNGRYGGSSAYWPQANRHRRRVFSLHGQPQMSIAFMEIESSLLDRYAEEGWKHPPAGANVIAARPDTELEDCPNA